MIGEKRGRNVLAVSLVRNTDRRWPYHWRWACCRGWRADYCCTGRTVVSGSASLVGVVWWRWPAQGLVTLGAWSAAPLRYHVSPCCHSGHSKLLESLGTDSAEPAADSMGSLLPMTGWVDASAALLCHPGWGWPGTRPMACYNTEASLSALKPQHISHLVYNF